MVRCRNSRKGVGSLQVAGATTVGAEDVVEGFIVAVASGTGLGRRAVIENGGLPGRIAVANVALCSGNDVSCRFVVDMAVDAGPLHFVMVRDKNSRPGTGPLCVASAAIAAAEDMVQRFIIGVAGGTGVHCGVVIKNGTQPVAIVVADIALRRGSHMID